MLKCPPLYPAWKERGCWRSPQDKETFTHSSPWSKPQQPLWGFLGLHQQNGWHKSGQPHVGKSVLGGRIGYGCVPCCQAHLLTGLIYPSMTPTYTTFHPSPTTAPPLVHIEYSRVLQSAGVCGGLDLVLAAWHRPFHQIRDNLSCLNMLYSIFASALCLGRLSMPSFSTLPQYSCTIINLMKTETQSENFDSQFWTYFQILCLETSILLSHNICILISIILHLITFSHQFLPSEMKHRCKGDLPLSARGWEQAMGKKENAGLDGTIQQGSPNHQDSYHNESPSIPPASLPRLKQECTRTICELKL